MAITYKNSGVDIEEGERLVRLLAPVARKTLGKQVVQGIGPFGALFSLDAKRYKNPVLVSSTDGVGTKLRVAFMAGRHDTVGIDLVAMSVNDILTSGAEPLFFLDYFATGKLSAKKALEVLKGIVKGCRQAGCALIGGETAEMPGFYKPGEYDLAGFAVGVVERSAIIDGSSVKPGDALIGLASSGLHSNGYSLARKVLFEKMRYKPASKIPGFFGGKTVGDALLKPTKIYVKAFRALKGEKIKIKAMAHITGGGIPGNLKRVLPKNIDAVIEEGSWRLPPIFELIQARGNVPAEEMKKTFNMGIGFIIIVPAKDAPSAISTLKKAGYQSFRVGRTEKGTASVRYA